MHNLRLLYGAYPPSSCQLSIDLCKAVNESQGYTRHFVPAFGVACNDGELGEELLIIPNLRLRVAQETSGVFGPDTGSAIVSRDFCEPHPNGKRSQAHEGVIFVSFGQTFRAKGVDKPEEIRQIELHAKTVD